MRDMYELITQNEANRIKQILNETGLKEDINIEVLNGNIKLMLLILQRALRQNVMNMIWMNFI